MADTATDIRKLIRKDRTHPDSAAQAHVVVGAGFLALGSVVAGVALLSLGFPGFLPLGYGIFRPMTMLALLIGFGTLSVVGGTFYVLPRLTGAPLWNERLAWAGMGLVAVVTLVGMVVVGAGLGDGGEPFALPWWLDLPMLAGLGVGPLVAVQTLRGRSEPRSYVTVPFVITGLSALPLVYAAGNLPGLASPPDALSGVFLSAAYPTLILMVGIGLLHYAVVMQTDRPLAGRQLPQVAYWSLLFGVGWFGVAQLSGGPFPDWLGTLAAVLGLGLPVGLAAATASILATTEGSWGDPDDPRPSLRSAVAGLLFGLVVAVMAAMGGFRSVAALVALTPFWEGITYGLVLGAIPLVIGSWSFHVLPRLTGRRLFTPELAARQVRLVILATGALVLTLVISGIVTGYSWGGGSFTGAYAAIGEGWTVAAGPGAVFLGLGTAAGLVAAFGNLTLASLIARTITRGSVTPQEVLVIGNRPD